MNKNKFLNHNCGKPYAIRSAKENKKVATTNENNGGGVPTLLRCGKCESWVILHLSARMQLKHVSIVESMVTQAPIIKN